MFNVDKIKQEVFGVVGFRQPLNPAAPVLTAAVKESRSGLIVNDNPLVKIDYLKATEDYHLLTDNQFSTQLEYKQKESIVNVCNQVFNKGSFLEQSLLYRYANNKTTLEILPNGFVGYEIEVTNRNDVCFEIKRIICEFDGTGDVDIMLFNSSTSTPLFTQTVTIASNNQEVVLNWKLDNSDEYFKGSFFIGYISTGLTVTPYKRIYENSNVKSCYDNLNVTNIEVIGHATSTLFDLDLVNNVSYENGLNLDLAVFHDYTNIIVQNERLFATAILYDLQISCLSQYLAALTSNREQRKAEQQAIRVFQEIEGQQGGDGFVRITGLRSQLNRSIDQVREEIQKLSNNFNGAQLRVDTMY